MAWMRADRQVILVEDNPDDEELIRLALDAHDVHSGLRVLRDGAEAIAWFRDHADQPDQIQATELILLDLKLPKADGFQVLAALRGLAAWTHKPVVVLTSSSMVGDRMRAYESGANSFVRKPTDFDDFERVVNEISRYWLQINDPGH